MAASDYTSLVQQFYVGFYGRPADPVGVDFWAGKVDEEGGDFTAVLDAFASSDEAESFVYSDSSGNPYTNSQLVENIYQNLFNRAAEAEGLQFYLDALDSGEMTLQTIVKNIIDGAEEGTTDRLALDNKVLAAEAYTADVAANEKLYESDSIEAARAFIASVDDSTTEGEWTQAAADAVAELPVDPNPPGPTPDPGDTYELSTLADLVVGTDADDVINGYVGENSAMGTLADTAQTVDIVKGGEGNDTIKLQTQAGGTLGLTLDSVENVEYTVFSGQTFNMANAAGVESLVNTGSIASLTVTNASDVIDLSVQGVTGNSTTVDYRAAAVTSAEDVQKIAFDGATDGHVVDFDAAVGGIEALEVSSIGSANEVSITDVPDVQTVTITGDQNLDMDFVGGAAIANLKTVNAADATGAIDIDLATNVTASDMSVVTGAGDDKVVVANLDENDSVDLGDGQDKLTIEVANESVAKAIAIKNTEVAAFDVTGANSFNMSGATELESLEFGLVGTLGLTKLAATADEITYDAGGATANSTFTTVSYGLNDASGSDDSLTINVTNVDANDNFVDPTKGVQFDATLAASGVESLTVSTEELGANSDSTTAATADGGFKLTLTDSDLAHLTLKGATLIDAQTAAMADLHTIDASEASGGVILDVAAAADASDTGTPTVSITTGAGADYVQNVLGSVLTTVKTGGGNDIITAQGAAFTKKVTIDAGAGDDSIDISAQASTGVETVITTGDGVDTIKVDDADDSISVTDFNAGNGGDKLAFKTNSAVDSTGPTTLVTYEEIDSSTTAVSANTGLVVVTNTIVDDGSLTLDEILPTGAGASFDTAGDIMYVAYTDGTDTYIAKATEVGNDGVSATDTLTTVVTLTGINEPGNLVADNFADFL